MCVPTALSQVLKFDFVPSDRKLVGLIHISVAAGICASERHHAFYVVMNFEHVSFCDESNTFF